MRREPKWTSRPPGLRPGHRCLERHRRRHRARIRPPRQAAGAHRPPRATGCEALAAELSALVPCDGDRRPTSPTATAPAQLFAETSARGLFVDTLVNNAGYGVPGPLPVRRLADARRIPAGDDRARSASSPTCTCRRWKRPAAAASSTSPRWPGWCPPRRAIPCTARPRPG